VARLAHAARDQIKAMIANALKGLDTILASFATVDQTRTLEASAAPPYL
jgi:hypothetical protein